MIPFADVFAKIFSLHQGLDDQNPTKDTPSSFNLYYISQEGALSCCQCVDSGDYGPW